MRSRIYSPIFVTSRRQVNGLTLIEVVAAVTLVGTLLVFIIKSSTQNRISQWRLNNGLEGVQLADQLIASWLSSPAGIPRNDSGKIGDSFVWETNEAGLVSGLKGVEIIELTISRKHKNGIRRLFSVELVRRDKLP